MVAVGKLTQGPLVELWNYYARQMKWRLHVQEVTSSKARTALQRIQQEGEILKKHLKTGETTILLDDKGVNVTTAQLCDIISHDYSQGKPLSFVIGGADGLCASLKERSTLQIAFGRVTWPHLWVRVMLLEQLYRCEKHLKGHPYHRP